MKMIHETCPGHPDATLEARHRAAAAVLADCTWDKENGLLTLVYDKSPRN